MFYRKDKDLQNNYNTVLEINLRKESISRITLTMFTPWFFTSASFGTMLMVHHSSTKWSPFHLNLVASLLWNSYAKKLSTLVHQQSMTMEISSLSSPEPVTMIPVCYPPLRRCIFTLSKTTIPSSLMFLFIVLSYLNLSKICFHKLWLLQNQQWLNISQSGVWMMSFCFGWAAKRRWIGGGYLESFTKDIKPSIIQ